MTLLLVQQIEQEIDNLKKGLYCSTTTLTLVTIQVKEG